MEIKYIWKNDITKTQQRSLDDIEKACFGFSSTECIENGEVNLFAVDLGVFLLFDDEKIVGNVFLYKRLSEYDGQSYCLGGLGGLAVMPEYRGKGYARQLAEKALKMSYDIGIDVACLFMNRDNSLSKFYETLGYAFIDRRGYYFNSLHTPGSGL